MSPASRLPPSEQINQILSAAIHCIEETSVMDFTMAALSKASGLSMGSIYKHIQTKEDVFVALAIEMYQQLQAVFTRIFALPASVPARFIALSLTNEQNANCYSFGGHLDMLVSNEAILKRASRHWIEKLITEEEKLELLVLEFINQAVMQGDLPVSENHRESLTSALLIGTWSMQMGHLQVARQRHLRHLAGREIIQDYPLTVETPIVQAQKAFLNSFPFKQKVSDDELHAICRMMEDEALR